MPTTFAAKLHQDVIDFTRTGRAPPAQIAKAFGLSAMMLKR
ncbi:hypothetical protein [Paenarthrobacter nicotinovorans]